MFSLPDNIFSLESGIYICFGTVLGSLISGGLLIINNSKNNNFQLERENQQRIWQEETDRQKWYREKIYDSYRSSIRVLTKIVQEQFEIEFGDEKDNRILSNKRLAHSKLILEFLSEFAITIAGYPGKDSEEFKETIAEIQNSLDNNPANVRNSITKMMEQDPRIKSVENNNSTIIKK